ncbi:hypothetical protein [Virgibacillus dokdonensis]|uniref:hypothetical protein n=1 Tax=Virgibacillus dokdonensis TaxID=302167 RepID=UPI00098B3958|nr:hypothetical protein [Virgibacillus dokdonensis]
MAQLLCLVDFSLLNSLDWAEALQQLIEILDDAIKHTNKSLQKLIKGQVRQWRAGLPRYIKGYMPNLVGKS